MILRRVRPLLLGAALAIPTPRATLPPLLPPGPCEAPAPAAVAFDVVLVGKDSGGLVRYHLGRLTLQTDDAGSPFSAQVLDVNRLHVTIEREILVASPGLLPEPVVEQGEVGRRLASPCGGAAVTARELLAALSEAVETIAPEAASDWIRQVAEKSWADDEVLSSFVRCLGELVDHRLAEPVEAIAAEVGRPAEQARRVLAAIGWRGAKK